MSGLPSAIYEGEVVHKRLRPFPHALRYRVFSLLIDCADLEQLDSRLRLFSHNRFNLVSLHEADHGNGGPLHDHLDDLAAQSGAGKRINRFMLLCYPRILGCAFNPLSVYFGLDGDDRVVLVAYEVNNTFGQRKTYVLPVDNDPQGVVSQSCRKRLYVSPFNDVSGHYAFHVTPPAESLTVGVALSTSDGPLLKAHFRGHRKELTDSALISALLRNGWLTLKVIAGIHLEAAKLWWKGLRTVPRPPAPTEAVTFIPSAKEGP